MKLSEESGSSLTGLKRSSLLHANEYANQESRVIDQETLDEVIRRIVEVADPEKIILFGSPARGEMTRHSDLDLLIIKKGGDALDLMGRIYERLYGVRVAVDAVVVSPGDVERYKDSHALVIKPALREGKLMYENS